MEALAQTLTERVLIARKRLGMTQKEFADKLRRDGLHYRRWSAADISEIETGKFDPRMSEMLDMAHALGQPVSWFLKPLDGEKPLYHQTWDHRDDYIALPNEAWWTDNRPAEPIQRERLPLAFAR